MASTQLALGLSSVHICQEKLHAGFNLKLLFERFVVEGLTKRNFCAPPLMLVPLEDVIFGYRSHSATTSNLSLTNQTLVAPF